MRKALLFLIFLACGMAAQADERVVVGSKRFTESYILGEIVAQTARTTGVRAEHRPGLGNTAVVLEALKAGSIDIYPEYLGTIEQEILKLPTGSAPETIARELARRGRAHGVPLGFSNSYALATAEALAGQRGLRRISDLRAQPDLRIALSQEFFGRADGWPGLAARYGLPQRPSAIDQPSTRAIANPGGSNERFAKSSYKQAKLTIHTENLTIFDEIMAGRQDIFVTEAAEALVMQRQKPGLCAVNPDKPLQYGEIAFLLPRGDTVMKQFVDQWLHLARASGEYAGIEHRWLR